MKLTFLDAQGEQIKSFTSEQAQSQSPKAEDAPPETPDEEEDREKKDPRVPKEAGMNRFLWNTRYPDPKKVDGYVASEAVMAGPVAAPGTYHVQLTVADQTLTEAFEVQKDPRVPATQEDLDSQFKLLLKVRDKLSETHDAINTLRNIRQQVEDWEKRTRERKDHEAVSSAARSLKEKLSPIEDELTQSRAKTRQDTMNFPAKLNGKLAWLAGVVASAQAAPTRQQYELYADLAGRIDVQIQRLQEIIDTDVAAFNGLMRESEMPAVIPIATLASKR